MALAASQISQTSGTRTRAGATNKASSGLIRAPARVRMLQGTPGAGRATGPYNNLILGPYSQSSFIGALA